YGNTLGFISGANLAGNDHVDALAVVGPTLCVGGAFTFDPLGGKGRNLAAFDATTGQERPWNPDPDRPVPRLGAQGSTLYVGGAFTTISGVSRARVASFDMGTGAVTGWSPGVDGVGASTAVSAIAVSGSTVYLGGTFDTIGGSPRNNIAAVDVAT